jgi:hypothetical protein
MTKYIIGGLSEMDRLIRAYLEVDDDDNDQFWWP